MGSLRAAQHRSEVLQQLAHVAEGHALFVVEELTRPRPIDGIAVVALFDGTPTEPLVPMGSTELAEAKALVRFGEVGVSNPAFLAVLQWARAAGVPVEGIDPDEEFQAEQFVANIGYWELVRRTLRERRVGRRPPDSAAPDDFALTRDKTIHPGAGSERYALAREESLFELLQGLWANRPKVAVGVDRELVERPRTLVLGASVPRRG